MLVMYFKSKPISLGWCSPVSAIKEKRSWWKRRLEHSFEMDYRTHHETLLSNHRLPSLQLLIMILISKKSLVKSQGSLWKFCPILSVASMNGSDARVSDALRAFTGSSEMDCLIPSKCALERSAFYQFACTLKAHNTNPYYPVHWI